MKPLAEARTVDIEGLTADSRRVARGYLFAALPGSRHDGRAFIGDAVARGAAAILAPEDTVLPETAAPQGHDQRIALLTDPNPRRRFACMAARFYGRQPRRVAAVTGTNGKTSVAGFTRQIWSHTGHRAASLGTLGLTPPDGDAPASLTTPDPVDLHRCLAALAERGFDHLALEASSHGLDQFRLDGVEIAAAAFTNLSRDHLDYHGTEAAYRAAKLRLFEQLLADDGTAVLNADSPEFDRLRAVAARRGLTVLAYGIADSDLRLAAREATADGQRLILAVFGKAYAVDLPLLGNFQAGNAMAALGLAIATGVEVDQAVAALGHLEVVPGRLELVARTPAGARIYVDYAHTPDALRTVLREVRPHTRGRLVVVFGCGGDRDRGKRPIMGAIAGRLADRAIVTDDNPRGEDPAAVRAEILSAVPAAREIGDRRAAIETAISELAPDDVLILAGKGHETGQIVGLETLPFDDREVARAALARLPGGTP